MTKAKITFESARRITRVEKGVKKLLEEYFLTNSPSSKEQFQLAVEDLIFKYAPFLTERRLLDLSQKITDIVYSKKKNG